MPTTSPPTKRAKRHVTPNELRKCETPRPRPAEIATMPRSRRPPRRPKPSPERNGSGWVTQGDSIRRAPPGFGGKPWLTLSS
ncbi:hypothetical protein MRB53_037742 [Persea americana]|nr:hypothetical protein MRB53_037742 [Persea americana]